MAKKLSSEAMERSQRWAQFSGSQGGHETKPLVVSNQEAVGASPVKSNTSESLSPYNPKDGNIIPSTSRPLVDLAAQGSNEHDNPGQSLHHSSMDHKKENCQHLTPKKSRDDAPLSFANDEKMIPSSVMHAAGPDNGLSEKMAATINEERNAMAPTNLTSSGSPSPLNKSSDASQAGPPHLLDPHTNVSTSMHNMSPREQTYTVSEVETGDMEGTSPPHSCPVSSDGEYQEKDKQLVLFRSKIDALYHQAHPGGWHPEPKSVDRWREQVSTPPTSTFSHDPRHYFCDIDTDTGKLLPEVDQGHTIPQIDDHKNTFRRYNWTSNYLIHRELTVRKKLQEEAQESQKRQQEALQVQLYSPPVEEDPHQVRVNCFLRPAKCGDLNGIVAVYNAEVRYGVNTPDIAEVSPGAFRAILDDCALANRQFIVAVKRDDQDDLLDPAKWPPGSSAQYAEYRQWREMQNRRPAMDTVEPCILGFGYFSEHDAGLAVDPGSARFTQTAHVYVHPDHRQLGLGRALLDRLLRMTCPNYIPKEGYNWECADPGNAYNDIANRNTNRHHRIVIEALFRGPQDEDLPWKRKFLEEEFSFQLSGHLSQTHRSQRGADSEWLDKLIWIANTYQEEIVFRSFDWGVPEPAGDEKWVMRREEEDTI